MVEDEEEPPDGAGTAGGGGGGPLEWLTGGTAFVKALTGLVVALGVLVGGLATAGVIGPRDDDDDGATATTAVTTSGGGFSTPPGLFDEITRPNGRAYFDGDALLVTALRPGRPFVVPAETEEHRDVALRVSGQRLSGSPDYGIGLLCRYQSAGTYYLLAVLSGGRYNVVRYERGRGRSLTGGIQTSGAIGSGELQLEARCVGDSTTILSLFVNGTRVARVTDESALETGGVGLRVGSGEARVTCRFDRFELRSL